MSAFKWIFFRLPPAFSLTFLTVSLWWALYGFHFLDAFYDKHLANSASYLVALLPDPINSFLNKYLYLSNLDQFAHALIILFGFVLGFLIAYNISAGITFIVFRLRRNPVTFPGSSPSPPNKDVSAIPPFSKVNRIGIVLAGGGAKGAFQAGAMKAIYEYLDRHQALGKVKVIASTSIGSWNALFWLAHLIKADQGESRLETWWKSISAKTLIAPSWYFPRCTNAFLSPRPWQNQFDQIFLQDEVKKLMFDCSSDIHFYMTRSNVRTGNLECATNNPDPEEVNNISYDRLATSKDADEFLRRIKMAVFASMDLPPLFPYTNCNDELYEDGGIIDNLPISFAAVENCDLIFILPLNSDFEESPNQNSIIYRVNRVMDVQQGALERQGFKLLYLYNELAALRSRVEELEQSETNLDLTKEPRDEKSNKLRPMKFALQRRHEQIRVFAVCPHKSFALEAINTRELWNRKGARKAFDVMYGKTAELLSKFNFDEPQTRVRVAVVTQGKKHTWDDQF